MSKNADNKLNVGYVNLTRIWQQLAPISDSKLVADFLPYVREQWRDYLLETKEVG